MERFAWLSNGYMSAISQSNVGYATSWCLPMSSENAKTVFFNNCKVFLALFNISCDCTNAWGSYKHYFEPEMHEISRINTQKIKCNNLNFRIMYCYSLRPTHTYLKPAVCICFCSYTFLRSIKIFPDIFCLMSARSIAR